MATKLRFDAESLGWYQEGLKEALELLSFHFEEEPVANSDWCQVVDQVADQLRERLDDLISDAVSETPISEYIEGVYEVEIDSPQDREIIERLRERGLAVSDIYFTFESEEEDSHVLKNQGVLAYDWSHVLKNERVLVSGWDAEEVRELLDDGAELVLLEFKIHVSSP